MSRETILQSATFAPALRTYWLVNAAWVMLVSCVFSPLIPLWFMGIGQWWTRKAYNALQCHLTERSLVVRSGVSNKVEKNIPLEKITDLSLRQGIIQRWFGVHEIRVETAGGSGGAGPDAMLVGVVEAEAFRDAVLARRDEVSGTASSGPKAISQTEGETLAVLMDIRDSLVRIESALSEKAEG